MKPITRILLGLSALVLAGIAIACSPKPESAPGSPTEIKAGETPTEAQKAAMRAQHTPQGGAGGGGYGGRPSGYGGR